MLLKMGKIQNFQNAMQEIINRVRYIGKNTDGLPMYDINIKAPTITMTSTIKVHGTFGGIIEENGIITIMSKRQKLAIIVDNDMQVFNNNAGFHTWVFDRIDIFREIFCNIRRQLALPTHYPLAIFGEFAGKGIQKGVGVSELDKFFYIFQTLYKDDDKRVVFDLYVIYDFFTKIKEYTESNIFHADSFPIHSVVLDLSDDMKKQDFIKKVQELVAKVEQECPVAKRIATIQGKTLTNTIGEGLVWKVDEFDTMFKTKGEKHQKSKDKKFQITYTNEELKDLSEFVESVAHIDRLEQGLNEVFGIGNPPNITKIGDYFKWISTDINDECQEEITQMLNKGFTRKQLFKAVNNKVKVFFVQKLNEVV